MLTAVNVGGSLWSGQVNSEQTHEQWPGVWSGTPACTGTVSRPWRGLRGGKPPPCSPGLCFLTCDPWGPHVRALCPRLIAPCAPTPAVPRDALPPSREISSSRCTARAGGHRPRPCAGSSHHSRGLLSTWTSKPVTTDVALLSTVGAPGRSAGCGRPRSEAPGEPGVSTRPRRLPVSPMCFPSSPGIASAQAAKQTPSNRSVCRSLKSMRFALSFQVTWTCITTFSDGSLTPYFKFRGA